MPIANNATRSIVPDALDELSVIARSWVSSEDYSEHMDIIDVPAPITRWYTQSLPHFESVVELLLAPACGSPPLFPNHKASLWLSDLLGVVAHILGQHEHCGPIDVCLGGFLREGNGIHVLLCHSCAAHLRSLSPPRCL